ncbi:GNAT family N-acetyltransferase [Halobium salinum]|uniref:GNAT family N-acetyltransferase n=1 Tax=Halobium salinum TaxID=1364940 RepID=A0ABD5P663_9EURY|nr:GNAT family protein [Halobium salinum]
MPGPAVLHGDRVTLRTVERDDAAFMQRSSADPEIRVPLGSSMPENENQAESNIEEWVENDKGVSLLVCVEGADGEDEDEPEGDGEADDDGPVPIGMVAAKGVRWDRTELVYWFVPEYQGEGYGTESIARFADYVFESFPTHRMHIRAFDFNQGSRGVARKLGFEEEGRFREARFVRGEYVDVCHYGMLRREWAETGPLADLVSR